MEQVLYQQQKQQLMITAKMEQQLTLLHMPIVDLETYIIEQALENPLIDMEPITNSRHNLGSSGNDHQEWLSNQKQHLTLYDYLLEQAGLLKLRKLEQAIIRYLIFLIDENGYFQGDIQEVSRYFAVSAEKVEDLLHKIQGFEPVGIGARNLQECMLLQLRSMDNCNELVEKIVTEVFDLLLERKWKEISRVFEVEVVDVQFAIDSLKTLSPRPGLLFQKDVVQSVKPELMITKGDDGFVIKLNEALYPNLQVDLFYQQKFGHVTDANDYLKEKQNHLAGLKRALAKRKRTLMDVMRAIVERQMEFFEKGVSFLKPLIIKEIAESVGLHESTVSRAVHEKYVQTPHGLFELKYFFTTSISRNEDEAASS